MQVRRATVADMYEMQHCNLRCLPENYNMRYYLYHVLSWPGLLYVQEDYNRNAVGYVLSKVEEEETAAKVHGHITSIAVLRTHRRLGIASRVMRLSMAEMRRQYDANFCSLHVRKTNDAALHLYQDTLGFRCANVEERYYTDDEDAFHMKCYFKGPASGFYVTPDRRLVREPHAAAAPSGSPAAHTAQTAARDTGGPSPGETTAVATGGGGGGRGDKRAAADMRREQLELAAELLEEDLKRGGGRRQTQKGGKGKAGKR